jgi:glycosyltransferase involved in cell wall biosynthesis
MTNNKKSITLFTPCYNEEENIELLYNSVRIVTEQMPQYDFEHVFIDNASTDNTLGILKQLAERDSRVKIIANVRNFGHVRSPYYGLMQCAGDAVICIVADLQDPPSMIPEFIKEWENGHPLVLGIKTTSKENWLMYKIRTSFYSVIKKVSDTELLSHFTGFGLYDQKFLSIVRLIDDPYPYFRGMVVEYGWNIKTMEYTQMKRQHGKTKNNFFTLYDIAMLGFVNHSKVPLRLSAFIGFFTAILSFLVALIYFIYKLIFWNNFEVGLAPLVIGVFFFGSVQLFFIGIIGEYIGAIHTQVRKRPLVIEKERVNL